MHTDDSFLKKLQAAFAQVVEKTARKCDVDVGHYGIRLTAASLDANGNIIEEYTLYDNNSPGYCLFCHSPSYYYHPPLDGYLCASCFDRIYTRENEKIMS